MTRKSPKESQLEEDPELLSSVSTEIGPSRSTEILALRKWKEGDLPESTRAKLHRYAVVTENLEALVLEIFLADANRGAVVRTAKDLPRESAAWSVEIKETWIVNRRIQSAWANLHSRFPNSRELFVREEMGHEEVLQTARRASESAWGGREGWETEPLIPCKERTTRVFDPVARTWSERMVPEDEGYLIYNQLVGEKSYRPFRTTSGEVRVAVPSPEGLQVLDPCNQEGGPSSAFLSELGYSLYTVTGDRIPRKELGTAAQALISRALSKHLPFSRIVRLWLRVAPAGKLGTRIDLADPLRRSIILGPEGWSIERIGHPTFDLKAHMLPLPTPAARGDPSEGWKRVLAIWRFINIKVPSQGADPRLLLLAEWVEFLTFPASPKTATIILGAEGAGKTSAATRIQALVDPSELPPIKPPEDDEKFADLAVNHVILNLDNVSRISPELSDNLARYTTGIGLPKRKLYANSEELVARALGWPILNGITATPGAPDLLRRGVFIEVQRPSEVIPIEPLEADWTEARADIFGGLLDLCVLTLRELRDNPPSLQGHSMADYIRVGQAMTSAMGLDVSEFNLAWEANVERSNTAAAENPWVVALAEFFGSRKTGEFAPMVIATWVNENCKSLFNHQVTAQQVGFGIQRAADTLKKLGIHLSDRQLEGRRLYFRIEPEASGNRRTSAQRALDSFIPAPPTPPSPPSRADPTSENAGGVTYKNGRWGSTQTPPPDPPCDGVTPSEPHRNPTATPTASSSPDRTLPESTDGGIGGTFSTGNGRITANRQMPDPVRQPADAVPGPSTEPPEEDLLPGTTRADRARQSWNANHPDDRV
jgi:hypothetical protein